jgi:hypothetical protein
LDGGIIVPNPAGGFRHVEVRNQITHLNVVGERLITVSEALGDVQLTPVLRTKLKALPTAKRGRVRPKIYNGVPDPASDAPDELCLTMWVPLKMHPANRAPLHCPRRAVLRKARLKTPGGKLARTKRASEGTPLILDRLQFDEPTIIQRCRMKFHLARCLVQRWRLDLNNTLTNLRQRQTSSDRGWRGG